MDSPSPYLTTASAALTLKGLCGGRGEPNDDASSEFTTTLSQGQLFVTAIHTVTSDDIRVIVCIVFDRRAPPLEIAAFKDAVIRCPSVLHAVELSGTFDFMVEASIPDMEAYTAQLGLCADTVAKLIERYEANFVCRRFVRMHEKKQAVWVPSDDGMVRIDSAKIDKVTAEGDYMRVHSAEQSWTVHSTMGALSDCLDPESFVRLHRSLLVRRDFIERLVHDQSHWMARLNDGTLERVAKGNVVALLDSVRNSLSSREAASPIIHTADELSPMHQRKWSAERLVS